ncbi:MAG: hypothetical protein ACOVT5_15955 [Armatimonadaceae bacterium]
MKDTIRTPTSMRGAFEAALSRACNRPATVGELMSGPNVPTLLIVNEALRSTTGYRKVPEWEATRRERRR